MTFTFDHNFTLCLLKYFYHFVTIAPLPKTSEGKSSKTKFLSKFNLLIP